MATKSSTWLTLLDRANRTQNGSVMEIVEAMNRSNPILDIMPFATANMATHHIFNKRTALPSIDWLSPGEGRSFDKSSTTAYTETIGFAGKLSRVPDDLVKLCTSDGEAMELRRSEDLAFVEACAQEMADTLFYGTTVAKPKEINGFATRRASLSQTDDYSKLVTYDNGGTGSDLSSIYVVEFGPTAISGMVPPNFPAGVMMNDLGKLFLQDPDDSTKYTHFWVSEFGFAMGLIERSNRSLRRIANIETSGSSNTIDPDNIIKAVNDLPGHGRNAFLLLNSTIMTQIEIFNKDYVKTGDLFGTPIPAFRGQVPFVICDAIKNTETAVA